MEALVCRDDSVEQTFAGVQAAQALDQPPVTWNMEIFTENHRGYGGTWSGQWAKENSGARGQSGHYLDTGDMGTLSESRGLDTGQGVTCRSGQWTLTPGLIMTQFDPGPDKL